MSLTINAPATIETRPPLQPVQQPAAAETSQPGNTLVPAIQESGEARLGNILHKALQQLAGQSEREHRPDSAKAFARLDKLSHSLQKMFGEAREVEKHKGEEEIREGGLKRVEKDLGKFFHEMGMPKRLARQFAKTVTDALGTGAEEVSFSYSASHSTSLAFSQQQQAYLANGEGSAMVGASAETLQITAVQTRSFDFSLNLRTGELKFSSNRSESLAVQATRSMAVAAAATQPAEQRPADPAPATAPEPSPAPALGPPVEGQDVLQAIQQQVRQSSLVQSQPAEDLKTEDEATSPFDQALAKMRQMVDSLNELSGQVHDLFEPLVEISNLRLEQDDGDDYLRFTVDALAPVGLSAVDRSGHATTVYPSQDGTLARTSDPQVQAAV